MNNLPISLNDHSNEHKICLILEGFEEEFYFKRLQSFPCFSKKYKIKPINAKSASNISAIYQDAYASDSYEIILIMCDMDRVSDEYDRIVKGVDAVLGEGKAETIIIFTRPCTLQIILSHFDEVKLITQAKPAARELVEKLTGIKNYDAHQNQLSEICDKIFSRSYPIMKERVIAIGDDRKKIPSSNIVKLFQWLESDNTSWIKDINNSLNEEDK